MDRLIGVFLVALSAACFGTNAIFARIGYDAGANVSTFLFIRFAIASLVMFLIMTARGLNFCHRSKSMHPAPTSTRIMV